MSHPILAYALPALVLGATAVRADLHFPETRHDAGELLCGARVSHAFAFVNRGPEAVEVTDTRTGCGCLTPRLDRRVYQPGEKGEVRLEVNTLSVPPGSHTWRVQVFTRQGGQARETPLYVSGRVVAEIQVQPPVLTVFADQAVGHTITFTDLRPPPLTVTSVRASSPHLAARVTGRRQNDAGHWVHAIQLDVAADCPEGRHEEVVSIDTDDPAYRDLRVPVTVVKRPRNAVTAVPGRVTLLAPAGQPVPSRVVLLHGADDRPVEVERVEADDPAVVCHWAPGPGSRATVRVGADRARMKADVLDSVVRVHVREPARQVVTIPVTVRAP
jgi:hypothetical protein